MEKSGAVETVSVIVALAVYVPLVTVTVMGNVPAAAVVGLTTKSRPASVFTAALKVCCGHVTPAGSPVTVPFTVPLNPPRPVTAIEIPPVWPKVSERLAGKGVSSIPGVTWVTSENCAWAEMLELEHEIVTAEVPETAILFRLNFTV